MVTFGISENIWSEDQILTTTDLATRNTFGISIALSHGTALIGASVDSESERGTGSAFLVELDVSTGVDSASDRISGTAHNGLTIQNAYPNPFSDSTTLSFHTRDPLWVTLTIYDVLGREIAVIFDQFVTPGTHRVEFNSQNLRNGRYIAQYQTPYGIFFEDYPGCEVVRVPCTQSISLYEDGHTNCWRWFRRRKNCSGTRERRVLKSS